MHNTKINDFDIKLALLMSIEQFLKNRLLVPILIPKLNLILPKYMFYTLITHCTQSGTELTNAQKVIIQITGITEKSMI